MKRISSSCWRSGSIQPWKKSKRKYQREYGKICTIQTRSVGCNGNGYPAPLVSNVVPLDKDGLAHKDEYLKMFDDCGWEYIQDYFGYSYFRKVVSDDGIAEEIF